MISNSYEDQAKSYDSIKYAFELGHINTRSLIDRLKLDFPILAGDRKASCTGNITYYGKMNTEGKKFFVKCDFLKIVNTVLMFFQPDGDFCDHTNMEDFIKNLLNNHTINSVTDARNFHVKQICDSIIQKPELMEITSLPYGAKSAVDCEDKYTLEFLIKKIENECSNRSISCTKLKGEIIEYKPQFEKNEQEMYAEIVVDEINSEKIAFFSTSGRFADRKMLTQKAHEWFPNATIYDAVTFSKNKLKN